MPRYATPEDGWRALMSGEMQEVRAFRRVLGALPSNPRCKMCKAPLKGVGASIMRLVGRAQSTMNPTFCGACLDHMKKSSPVGTGVEIEMTMLFVDVRGSTAIAERSSPSDFGRLMNRFYGAAGEVLTESDALIDKLMGDQAIGLYVPGFAGTQHAARAIGAGQALLEATGHGKGSTPWLSIGVGVYTGVAFIGVVGAHEGTRDVTALGDAVNTAARLCSMAGPGEVLVSRTAWEAAGADVSGRERRTLDLKGRTQTVDVAVFTAT